MSATPETDAAVQASGGDWSPVLRETCRRLERERDAYYSKAITNAGLILDARAEHDETLAQVKELIYIAGRAIDLAEIDLENDKFGVVSELRSDLEKIKRKEETK